MQQREEIRVLIDSRYRRAHAVRRILNQERNRRKYAE